MFYKYLLSIHVEESIRPNPMYEFVLLSEFVKTTTDYLLGALSVNDDSIIDNNVHM